MEWLASVPPSELPYSFIHAIPSERKRALLRERWRDKPVAEDVLISAGGDFAMASFLPWDSEFFQRRIYRIDLIRMSDAKRAAPLVSELETRLAGKGAVYAFALTPKEESVALEALKKSGWSAIETRVTYWRGDVDRFIPSRRSRLRPATEEDIPALEEIAVAAKNPLDRFHGDSFFRPADIERLMKEWVRASVMGGFADTVLVPATRVSAFVTLRYLRHEWSVLGRKIARIVLNAVHPRASGWYPKLVSETLVHLKSLGVTDVVITTQAGNSAVIRTLEHLGFQSGTSTEVARKVFA